MAGMIGRLVDLKITTFPKRRQLLTMDLKGDIAEAYDKLKDHEVTVTIKRRYGSRTPNANRYAWSLMGDIADALTVRKQRPFTAEEVYMEAIREIPGVSDVLTVREDAADRLRAGWAHNGIGWQSRAEKSRFPGYVDVVLYYGSSSYDTRQMGALLDYLVALGQALGVPTDTPEMIEKYKYYWDQAERTGK